MFHTIQGRRIEYEFQRTGAPVMVFLHEALGSMAMWKDFPARCALAAGCDALVYSRYGYGRSEALDGARRVDYLHEEAFKSLPELLDRLEVERPILFGHSDGASIALLHAGGAERPVRGVIALAPHVMVDDAAIAGIEATKRNFETTDLRERLRRYHSNPDSAFWGWVDIYLAPEFRAWNIEEYLPRIACPVLAMQGVDDDYATGEQMERIARAAPQAEVVMLENCRHSPHRDRAEAVCEAVSRFVTEICK